VYPVPDGDTGTNLVLTVRAVVETLESSGAEDAPALARDVTRAALLGARGNSGVILSQMVRGLAATMAVAQRLDGDTLARALRAASDAAYRALRNPVEGTMLTVVREMAEEAELPDVRPLTLDAALERVVARGEDAVRRTPELLDVLRQAGVVDAGGAGLLEIVRGAQAAAAGRELPAAPAEPEELTVEAIHRELSRFRYCTLLVVEGEALDARSLERELALLGDSLIVVGDATALKVHVHTDDPGSVLTLATRTGVVEGVEIQNMHRQSAEREARLVETAPKVRELSETGVVAVALGAGNRRLFEGYGAARIVAGGPTMNPSTADLVAAIDDVPALEVIVLPNDANVVAAAEQAATLATKPARVVPTTSMQAGLAAMARFIPTRSAAENEDAMNAARSSVATGEVTRATRDATLDGVTVRAGCWFGLANGAVVACDDELEPVVRAVAARVAEGKEVLTLLTGADEPEGLRDVVARLRGDHAASVEIEVQVGGQPHYPLLLFGE
jgi:hypothetical protein